MKNNTRDIFVPCVIIWNANSEQVQSDIKKKSTHTTDFWIFGVDFLHGKFSIEIKAGK